MFLVIWDEEQVNIKDWNDFNQQFLFKFGTVKSCSSVAAKLKDKSFCSSDAVPEIAW